jgi:HK97 family phage portal protein
VTTLQAADGRVLRSSRPAAAANGIHGGFFPSEFPPMWSDGERWGPDGATTLRSYEAIYRSQPILAAVVDKLSRRIATLPRQILRGDPMGGVREPADDTGLASLLRRPMPRRSGTYLVACIATSLLVHGNWIGAKLRTAGPDTPPDMLWPLDWTQLSAYGTPGGTVEWWSTTQFEGVERFIAVEDTVHIAWPSPSGGEIGISPVEKLGVTIAIEDAAQREQTAVFKNGIRPSAAVSVDLENPTKEQLVRAGEIVKAAHRGVDKSGSWVWLGANTKITPLSFSPVEAALMDQRQRTWEEIAAVYDMAGPLSGDLTHGTYSNVQVILDSLYRDVIPPWTTLIVETFQAQLIDPEPAWMDLHIRFDFTDKLRGDPVTASQADRSDVEAGLKTRDEVRVERGYAPVGGAAAELTMNANNQAPVDDSGAASTSPPPGVTGREEDQ